MTYLDYGTLPIVIEPVSIERHNEIVQCHQELSIELILAVLKDLRSSASPIPGWAVAAVARAYQLGYEKGQSDEKLVSVRGS